MTVILIREGERFGPRDTYKGDTQRLEGYIKIEAEMGVMLPKAKECQEPPEAGRGKEGFSPRAFRGARPC